MSKKLFKKKSEEKHPWTISNVIALLLLSSLVFFVIKVGVEEYQPAEKERLAQEKIEKTNKEKEIAEAMVAKDKLEYVEDKLFDLEKENAKILESTKARTILDPSRLTRPRYIVEVMFRLWNKHGGKHDYVPFCIAAYESNFNTFTHNTKGEDSRGLFQVNVADPWHASRTNATKLFEPVYNMEYQFDELVKFEEKGIAMGLTGVDLILYVARYGQRPNWEKCSGYIKQTVRDAYSEYMNLKIN